MTPQGRQALRDLGYTLLDVLIDVIRARRADRRGSASPTIRAMRRAFEKQRRIDKAFKGHS